MIETFKKLFEILPDSDKWKFAALFLMMLIGMLLEVIGIGMIPVFISAVADPEMVLEHEWGGTVASYLGINNSQDLLLYGGIGLVVAFFVKGCYLLWFNYVKSKFVYNRFSIISSSLFKTYLTAPYTFHLNRNTAELIRNVTSETRYISNNVMMPSMNILMESITALGIFSLLFFSEPFITFISFIVIGGGGWLLLRSFRTKFRNYGQLASKERSRMIQGVNEGLGGFKEVTVMNRQSFFFKRFDEFVKNLTTAEIFKDVANNASKPTIEFIAVAGMIFIAFTMSWQDRSMATIISILTLFGAAMVRLMPAISKIISGLTQLRYYIYALDPVHSDINSLKKNYKNFEENIDKTEKLPFNHSIKLKDVVYRYPNSEENVLKEINLSIPKSSSIGFVGSTGAGKSTIVDIILGLLEPNKGLVLVDGVDINKNKRIWQNNVGYIPQFIYLSDDTIRNNIAFGISEEQISEEKVWAAIEAAQLEKFIDELPNGLDTMVGENGVRLSGGQRQRIGIARAIYNNPEVLIMDEGTSSLDNVTENKVISAIEALKGKRTVIMIAHRLSTVKNCDTLYMLKEGKIIEQGSYEELLKANKDFKMMDSVD